MGPSGGPVQTLLRDVGINPTLSPDGRYVVVEQIVERNGRGDWDLFLIDLVSRGVVPLVQEAGDDISPSWSPDGSWIVFASNRAGNYDLYRVRRDGGELVRITFEPQHEEDPDWSPTGQGIVFREGGDLAWIREDGTGRRRLTADPFADRQPAWSPDGRRVAFVSVGRQEAGTAGIFVLDFLSGAIRRVTRVALPGSDGHPSWSPDGNWIVFDRLLLDDLFADVEIFRVPANGGPPQNLTESLELEFHPFWFGPRGLRPTIPAGQPTTWGRVKVLP